MNNKVNVDSEQGESDDSIILLPPLVSNEVLDVSGVENIRNIIVNLIQELDALVRGLQQIYWHSCLFYFNLLNAVREY